MSHSSRLSKNDFEQSTTDQSTPPLAADQPMLEKAKIASSTMFAKIEESVQSRPLTSLGIAAGLGVLVAFWSKRK